VQVKGLIARGDQAFLIFMAAWRQQDPADIQPTSGCIAWTRTDETGIEWHLGLAQVDPRWGLSGGRRTARPGRAWPSMRLEETPLLRWVGLESVSGRSSNAEYHFMIETWRRASEPGRSRLDGDRRYLRDSRRGTARRPARACPAASTWLSRSGRIPSTAHVCSL